MIGEKFFDRGKTPQLWKNSLTVEKSLDCGKIPRLQKDCLIKEKFLNCGKPTSLTAEKNNRSNTFETFKAYVLILEQKLSLQ